MEGLISKLIRLQELIFAEMEHEAAHVRAGTKEIHESIEQIMEELPQHWVKRIQQLQSNGQPAVVPAVNGFCTFCRIQLPTSMFQQMRRSSEIQQCPCCARVLYIPESGGLQSGTGSLPHPGEGGIARFSSPRLIVPDLHAAGRDEALSRLVEVLTHEGWVDNPEEMLQAAIARENLVTTAVEYGLAFPHVRGGEEGGLVIALGLNKKGIHFGAPAGRLTRILFFSVIPQAASGFYLKVMASLVRVFRDEDARKQLLSAQNAEEVWGRLLEATRDVFP